MVARKQQECILDHAQRCGSWEGWQQLCNRQMGSMCGRYLPQCTLQQPLVFGAYTPACRRTLILGEVVGASLVLNAILKDPRVGCCGITAFATVGLVRGDTVDQHLLSTSVELWYANPAITRFYLH